MFGNRCEFMLAKEAGIPFTSWSPVLECTLNGQTPSGRSESWSTGYDTYIVDLDTDYVAGLASSDKVVGIRFVSNDHTCFSGVRIDYILVTGVASSGM